MSRITGVREAWLNVAVAFKRGEHDGMSRRFTAILSKTISRSIAATVAAPHTARRHQHHRLGRIPLRSVGK